VSAAFSALVAALLGSGARENIVALLFSTRLDETGTDGRSPYTVIAGAVALPAMWDDLGMSWKRLLSRSHVKAFHTKEFQDRHEGFEGWSDFKAKRFTQAQEKIVGKHSFFTVAVGVDRAAHAAIKKEMVGIKGFKADSDYGLCFRMLMMAVCGEVMKTNPTAKVAFMLESGAAGAEDAALIYKSVKHMTGPREPSRHAHMLGGFALVEKEDCVTLEAADFIAGQSIVGLTAKGFRSREKHLSVFVDTDVLRLWHKGMLDEKERRRAYHKAKKGVPSGAQPS
jgi:hypothetical protein